MITCLLTGAIAGTVTTPLDIMKALLQTQKSVKNKPIGTKLSVEPPVKHYNGIIDGMVWNYKNQVLAGLFRGIGPRVFWTSLQSVIMCVVYGRVLHLQADLKEKDE